MFRELTFLLSRAGAATLIAYIGWIGWDNLAPHKPEVDPLRKELGEQVVSQIVEDIRLAKIDPGRFALLHFTNDPTDFFTDQMQTVLESRGVLTLASPPFADRTRKLFRMPLRSTGTQEEALQRGHEEGLDGVVYGTLHSYQSSPQGAEIDVEVHLADTHSGKLVFTKRYQSKQGTIETGGGAADFEPQTGSWWRKWAGWAILVTLLPVFTMSFLRTAVRTASNRTNAFILGLYTCVDALLAYLLIVDSPVSTWGLLLVLAAVVAACAYNIRIMTFALRLES